jgi:hypothetical protein
MMAGDPHVGTLPQEFAVPMPSPLRILAYAALVSALIVAVYFCVQAAVMIYDLYSILQWLGGMTE